MSTRILKPERLTITARRDLHISQRTERGETFQFVEDPLRNKFFRLGEAEYALFAALDGRRTIAEAATMSAAAGGANALSQAEAAQLAQWLVAAGLATGGAGAELRAAPSPEAPVAELAVRWNPWSFRISFGSPDVWLRRLDPLGRVLFSRAFFVVWLVVVGLGVRQVIAEWSQIVRGSSIVWNTRGLTLLAIAWVLLKAWHELGHALACRRYGGHVGEVGLAFVLGMPSPVIDVSSIRRSPHKWERIIVSLAGVYLELLVAGTAMLVYGASHDPAVREAALTAAFVAGFGSHVVNLNPLMRFDGYYALSDFVEVPNLAIVGKEEAGRLVHRYLYGLDEPPPGGHIARPGWIAWYGLAAGAWRVFVLVSLVLLAMTKLGAMLTVLISLPSALAWFTRRRLARTKVNPAPIAPRRNRVRQCATAISAVVAVAALLGWLDPCRLELPAVVDYEPLTVVRAETPGFVRRVCVAGGRHVAAGTVLAELENPELQSELARAELAIEQSQIRTRMHRHAGAMAKEQIERAHCRALEVELAELKRRRDRLTIVAPVGGVIVSRGLEQAVGRRLEQGEEITSIGDDATKALRIALPQRLVAAIGALDNRDAVAVLAGRRESFVLRLTTCEPTASTRLIHPALSAEHGGATIVRRREATPEEAGERGDSPERAVTIAETLEPCFTMTVRTGDGADLRDLAAGRTGVVRIRIPWRAACDSYLGRAAAWLHAAQAE